MDTTNQVSRKRPSPDSSSMNPSRAPHDRLKSVLLPLSPQRDPELDARVRKDGTLRRLPDELEDSADLSLVLSAIVRHAGPESGLNDVYRDFDAAGDLVESNDALREALQDAWGKGEYQEILALEILQFRRTSPAAVTSTESHLLSKAFHDPYYVRDALLAFTRYLTDNCERFISGPPSTSLPYYAKYCSIVQSSGTGKSRLISELGESGVMVIYMNLRDKSDIDNYPLRDEIAASLLEFPQRLERKYYEARCSAFFAALFTVFRLRLEGIMTQKMSWKSASAKWQKLFGASNGHLRPQFFFDVKQQFDAVMRSLNATLPGEPKTPSLPRNSGGETTTPGVTKMPEPKFVGKNAMVDAFIKLLESCPELSCDKNHEPKVVIAIDEASILCTESDGVRPSDVICTAISLFSNRRHSAIWVVFASTEAHMADLAAPNKTSASLRVYQGGEVLYQPFTELGWDQHTYPLNKINLNEIATFDHISRYGRPLWFNSKKYLSGGVEEVVRTAQVKLLKDNHYAHTKHQALALLSQRFALDIIFGHPKAVQHVDEAVASHLRICITTTEDRSWRFTAYPSEPLLSHAAAEEMWRNSTLTNALAHLKTQLERGMIEKGKNGELVSRLLLLLAKDSCAKRLDGLGPKMLRYCCPIPVRWWLEELFGPNVWPKDEAQRKAAEEAFASATINFSHWISMSERIIPVSSDVQVVE
ncbi:hypothetical protein K439DRAFT_1003314 [Ramaria rubella]|nr:hypothetical protein K439DRAFT_1003314 [Ramaria rubella]